VFNIQAFRYYNAADFFIQTTVAIWRVEDNGEKQPGQKYHGATKDRHIGAGVMPIGLGKVCFLPIIKSEPLQHSE